MAPDPQEFRGGIQPLLFPTSVAIVGASERNPRPIEGALRGGRPVYLVNPNRTDVLGLPCHPTLAGVPGTPAGGGGVGGPPRGARGGGAADAAGVRARGVPGGGGCLLF